MRERMRQGVRLMGGAVAVWTMGVVLLLLAVIVYGSRDYARPVDVIIVLGASVKADGSPGVTLQSRVQQALRLWREGVAPTVICTGGITGKSHRAESGACRQMLIDGGVPPEAIYLEERSQNTHENAQYALEIMEREGLQTAVVVSSRYHLLRARWLFWRVGQAVHTSPSPIRFLSFQQVIYVHVREVGAFHWQLVRDVFNKTPHIHVPVP